MSFNIDQQRTRKRRKGQTPLEAERGRKRQAENPSQKKGTHLGKPTFPYWR
jgi:hypothetical protein